MGEKRYHGFVYLTTNLVNGKRYIGQTTREESKLYFGSGKAIKKALAKYGKENFSREILAYAFNSVDLDFLEMHFISERNALDERLWYNIAEGGKTTRGFTGKAHTAEHKEAIRQFMLKSHPNKGKKFSQTVRNNMSASKMGNTSKSSPEGREQARQLGLANKGRKRTAEQKAAMSTARTGKNPKGFKWRVLTTTGEIVVDSLKFWCAEHGINYHSLLSTLKTKKTHAKSGCMIIGRV